MELTYTSYLKIPELLDLQQRRSNPEEHDEMLFIIIHQAYELWFKQILFELDFMKNSLDNNNLTLASKTLKRVNTILKVLVHQIDILETMSPIEFLSFRNYLESASGFQSYQFRELEFLLGAKRKNILESFKNDEKIYKKLEKRFNSPSIWEIFLNYLKSNGFNIPTNENQTNIESSSELQEVFIEIYHSNSILAQFCELLVDFDEGLQEWRYRHIKMVERTIGAKQGTGGSSGAEYLKSTLFKPVFPDLWQIRARLGNVQY